MAKSNYYALTMSREVTAHVLNEHHEQIQEAIYRTFKTLNRTHSAHAYTIESRIGEFVTHLRRILGEQFTSLSMPQMGLLSTETWRDVGQAKLLNQTQNMFSMQDGLGKMSALTEQVEQLCVDLNLAVTKYSDDLK